MSNLVKVLQGIEFEPRAQCEIGNDTNVLQSRDDSFATLQSRGYERHPYMREYFALFIASLEGKLSADKQAVLDDMNQGRGEWFHDVLLANDTTITFYDGVTKIVHEPSELTHTTQKTFNLNGLKPASYYSVEQVFSANAKLGENIWTKEYDKLPKLIKTNSGILLPQRNVIRPVGCGDYDGDYSVSAYDYDGRASRGVVVDKKFSARNKQKNTEQHSLNAEMHKVFQAVQEGKNFEYNGHTYFCKDKQ